MFNFFERMLPQTPDPPLIFEILVGVYQIETVHGETPILVSPPLAEYEDGKEF